jgi:hypothetical protein
VRDNDSRPRSSYDSLCKQLHAAWESIVEHEKLDTIIILGDIVAGSEQGFMLPEAGKDTEW